jgi:hypothetical protein
MKFGKRLAANATPEWQTEFFNYKSMKKKIKHILASKKEREKEDKKKKRDKNRKSGEVELTENAIEIVAVNVEQPALTVEGIVSDIRSSTTIEDNRFLTQQVEDLVTVCPEESHAFLNAFQSEIDKVNDFYLLKEKEFEARGIKLDKQIEAKQKKQAQGKLKKAQIKKLQKAFQEHYRSLVLLDNYRKLNYLACNKILKKFAKYSKNPVAELLKEMIEQEPFFSSPKLQEMMETTENLFTDHIFEGNRKGAMQKLRLPNSTAEKKNRSISFRCGMWFGASFIITVLSFYLYGANYSLLNGGQEAPPNSEITFFIFRILAFPVVLTFFIALNMRIWEKYGINWIFIFELNPRKHLSKWDLLEVSLIAYVLMISMFLFYLFGATNHLMIEDSWAMPVSLLCFFAVLIFLPFPILFARSRWWLIKVIIKICIAPLVSVKFADFWFADQLTSMSEFLYEIQFIFCIYPTSSVPQLKEVCDWSYSWGLPLLNIFPLYCRFMQCLRRYYDSKKKAQLFNALKYLISILVMVISFVQKRVQNEGGWQSTVAWIVVWYAANVVSTLYKVIWDIYMDWGLFQVRGIKYTLLRKHLLLPPVWYYLAMVENTILRFLWLGIFLAKYYSQSPVMSSQIIQFSVALLELFRRFVWNIFRLEYEHLHNAEAFRAVTEMPLPFENDDYEEKPGKNVFAKIEKRFVHLREKLEDMWYSRGKQESSDDEDGDEDGGPSPTDNDMASTSRANETSPTVIEVEVQESPTSEKETAVVIDVNS